MNLLKLFLIITILIVPTYYSLVRAGFFPMQDDLQAFRVQQMDKCIMDLQLPCRWVPDAGYQYGYPQFIFYPPGVYYLGELFHLTGFQFIDSVKILFILGFIVSALTMFVFLRAWLGNWPALVGSILYAYAPYKAVEVYVRGAMSEFWSLAIFPLIFWSSYQLIKHGKLKYFIWLSISVALLLVTHSLMSMIFFPVAAIWIISLIWVERKFKLIPRVILSCLLGFSLAAFFVLPLVAEKPFVHSESLLGGYFDYRQHFVDLNQLFISNHWGYGSSFLGPGDDLSLSTGQVHWMAALVAIILSLALLKKRKKTALLILTLFLLSLLVLFMIHQKSSFIWEKISILAWLQFPWRLLAVSIFLLSILSAVSVSLVPKPKLGYLFGTVLIVGALALYVGFFHPREWFNLTDQEKFSGNLWQKELTISIFDYLPIYAKLPPTQKAPDLPEVMDGKVKFLDYRKGSDYQEGRVEVETGSANLRLPLYDFPGMKVTVDGKTVDHSHDDCRKEQFCLGLISFNLNQGQHIIKAELTNTLIRSIADLLTIMGMLAVAILIILRKKIEKGWYERISF